MTEVENETKSEFLGLKVFRSWKGRKPPLPFSPHIFTW